ncbi:MAG: hypothetical protein JNL80_17810 [Phycisphaerae bacterium]|nr:hypothetical protein [Phycisphaerae bacterium]
MLNSRSSCYGHCVGLIGSITALAPTLLVASASAVDLTVSSVEVNQAINSGSMTLVAKNATVVRVKVGVAGSAAAVPNVDAELRIYANGVEIPGSPFFSSNGPITAPLAPNLANENDTLNFLCVPPQSGDVDFVVIVNPLHKVLETNYSNNSGQLLDKNFVCRKMVELAYVSVNYTPGGGEPPLWMIEPGVGDAFLRGIYKTGDWNYHRSPLGALTWNSNINSSNNTLLSTLNDIRNITIPAAGYPKPEFIYGWLPGNPYSGNGQAIGIPGAAAFGNSEENRFQRTFAHEVGHLWGQQHNSSSIATIGFDVVNGLKDPLNLASVMPTSKKDVMFAGLLTNEAWVAAVTFNDCIGDSRAACAAAGGEGEGEGGASDAASSAGTSGEMQCIRLAGEYHRARGVMTLQPSLRLDSALPTVNDPMGDAEVRAYSAAGRLLSKLRIRTDSLMESCAGTGQLERTPVYVTLPESIASQWIARVEIRDVKSGALLARQLRSPNAPVASIMSIAPTGVIDAGGPLPDDKPGEALAGEVEVAWAASDADGDRMEAALLYSPDGGTAWYPVVVSQRVGTGTEERTRFSTANLPQSVGPNGRLKLRVSDGLNQSDVEFPQGMMLGIGSPPDVHIVSPNDNITVPQHASVVFQASAWDMEDRLLPESSIEWTSDIDGPVGTGRLFTSGNLSVGAHNLTLKGTDSSGLSTLKVIKVIVAARAVRSPDLNADGAVNAADLSILLGEWANDSFADLDLSGSVGASDLAILLGAFS